MAAVAVHATLVSESAWASPSTCSYSKGSSASLLPKIEESDLESTDFYLDMSPEDWEDMLANIQENGEASFDYTLNTIDLDSENGFALSSTGDQYRQDLFFRYNQTFQYFFDLSSRVPTEFTDGA